MTELLQPHPVAELFPVLDGAEFDHFKRDIAEHGLQEAIVLYEGKILDGRNRYRACLELGKKPRLRTYEGTAPVTYVWSMNGERRQLTPSQLAAIAVSMSVLPEYVAEAKKRQQFHGGTAPGKAGSNSSEVSETIRPAGKRALNSVAELMNVSLTQVQCAAAVKRVDPEQFARIAAGEISVSRAYNDLKPAGKRFTTATMELVEDIRSRAARGLSGEKIAREVRRSLDHVKRLARQHHIELPEVRVSQGKRADQIRELVEQGLTSRQVANKVGLSLSALHVIARRYGITWPNQRNKPREERETDIRQLAGEGMRPSQIAAKLNVSVERVRTLARRAGIELLGIETIGREIDTRRIIEKTVNGLEGYAIGLKFLEYDNLKNGNGFTNDEARYWAQSLSESVKPLTKLRSKLLEIANGKI